MKSQENSKHYCCLIKNIFFEEQNYKSVRDIYLKIINFEKIFTKIKIYVELLPLPYETAITKKNQLMSGNDNFYYISECYTSLLTWGPNPNKSHKIIMNKIYDIPLGWIFKAKKDAKTALALL